MTWKPRTIEGLVRSVEAYMAWMAVVHGYEHPCFERLERLDDDEHVKRLEGFNNYVVTEEVMES